MSARANHPHQAPHLAVPALLLANLALAILSAPLGAEESTPQPDWGQLHYRVHCQSCHGEKGQGDGPVAEVLKIAPPDLTLLSQKNGGTFPTEHVYRVIDGREEIRTHGQRDMPVWGLSFQDRSRDNDQEEEVARKIRDLVAYIESIQAEPSAEGDEQPLD